MTRPERVLRLDLAYDGTDFAGWQRQPGRRTVQGVVEEALGKIQGDRPCRVNGAGRTDAGVHARGQVADCRVGTPTGDEDLLYTLRRVLPPDVRATAVRTCDSEFDSRRQARRKTYVYRLDLTPHGDPFRRRWAVHVPWAVDLDRLGEALRALPGKRDWSGFAGAACEVEDRVRDLMEARLALEGPHEAALTFVADGFLNHMVRNLVGTVLEIARARMPVERIREILETGDRQLAGPTAPARGLCLERVSYDDDPHREPPGRC